MESICWPLHGEERDLKYVECHSVCKNAYQYTLHCVYLIVLLNPFLSSLMLFLLPKTRGSRTAMLLTNIEHLGKYHEVNGSDCIVIFKDTFLYNIHQSKNSARQFCYYVTLWHKALQCSKWFSLSSSFIQYWFNKQWKSSKKENVCFNNYYWI